MVSFLKKKNLCMYSSTIKICFSRFNNVYNFKKRDNMYYIFKFIIFNSNYKIDSFKINFYPSLRGN